MNNSVYFEVFYGLIVAALIALTVTPLVRVFAYKIGAVDVPRDNRRMHKKPMPLLGGLSIFLGFTISGLLFCDITPAITAAWLGGLLIIMIGILDDKYSLNAWVKLLGQIAAAVIAVCLGGIQIDHINLFGHYIHFGFFAIPITIFWIVGMTNAINLIDGLDGLACGVSAIASMSLLIVTLMHAELEIAMLTAILTGACIGFLPFNKNPAKIFMGDTGALFLGYMLSVLSTVGVFKTTAVVSFLIPVIIFGYPLFDTAFAFARRILQGRSPFSADRGHLHHRIIDMGFNVKQSVSILYCICSVLGILAIMLTEQRAIASLVILIIALVIGLFNYLLNKNKNTRRLTGLHETTEFDRIVLPDQKKEAEQLKPAETEAKSENEPKSE
ncbi:MAG: undecaprenyl/decaprenyl-phosphate alpha-N-acetylglucosaminyl 1-phosphate transferase [Clostridia bacterium]|nr:undecaprenyl/decaprenyl-phosphate alpha-N-acetylglucosaminyl 1-phosphate transferase [Clostridia bacterium]